MSDDLDILDATHETDPDPEPSLSPSPVMVDLRSTGGYACATSAGMLALGPGLSIVAAEVWEAAQGHKGVAGRLEAGTLIVVDLAAVYGDALVDLAKRTVDRGALTMLLEREDAKPILGGPASRKNKDVLAVLRRKLAKG